MSLQPLPMDMAHELDLALSRKASAALGVAFRRSPLLFLQLGQLGVAFPSIFRLNGELAIASLLRSLNHPLPPFRMLSVLTWVNWSCQEGAATRSMSALQKTPGRTRVFCPA